VWQLIPKMSTAAVAVHQIPVRPEHLVHEGRVHRVVRHAGIQFHAQIEDLPPREQSGQRLGSHGFLLGVIRRGAEGHRRKGARLSRTPVDSKDSPIVQISG
jgi:hypothetical protein